MAHAVRRRLVVALVVATAATVGGVATRDVVQDDGVEVRGPISGDPGRGVARWDAAHDELVYSSVEYWSGSCFPDGSVARRDGVVHLTIGGDGPGPCTDDAMPATAVVSELGTKPETLRVTEGGRTREVPIFLPDDGFDLRVVTSRAPGGERIYPRGAVVEVRISPSELTQETAIRPAVAPWRRTWAGLAPGRYEITAEIRPCDGSTLGEEYADLVVDCDFPAPATEACFGEIDLVRHAVVRVLVTYGAGCTTEVAADDRRDPRPGTVRLITSEWRPGQGGDGAVVEGMLAVDVHGCVFVERRRARTYVAWPSGWTASFDRDQRLTLLAPDGQAIRTGDTITTGGGTGVFAGGLGDCANVARDDIFVVRSAVDIID